MHGLPPWLSLRDRWWPTHFPGRNGIDALACRRLSMPMRQLFWFAIAGTLGFLVDAGVVSLLVNGLDWNPYLARLLSFLCAVATTFAFNRTVTFAAGGRGDLGRQAGQYLVAMLGGFAVNYGAYALLVYQFELVRQWPVIGVAAGSIAGLVVNFLAARFWVFGARAATPDHRRKRPP